MKKTSKIKSVQGNGTWNGKDGTLYYRYDYIMEDGASLQASHKEQNKWKVGDEVEYEITQTHPTYGASGKVGKPQQGYSGGKFQRPSEKEKYPSFSLSYAKDLAVAHIGQGKEFSSKQITMVADEFLKWLNDNS